MSLTVRNAARTLFVLNLRHDTRVEGNDALKPSSFRAELPVEGRDGALAGMRLIEKSLPASITWLPGQTLTDLPDDLLQIEEFQRARNARILVVAKDGAPGRVAGEPKRYAEAAPAHEAPPAQQGATATTPNTSGEQA